MSTIQKNRVLKDLKTIFRRALKDKKWHVALQAAALLGKCVGIFDKRRFPDVKRISEMSERELRDFIMLLEKYDPELKAKREREEQGIPEKKPLIPKHPPPCVCPECLSYG